MYKQIPNNPITGQNAQCIFNIKYNSFIPFDPANTDYANFKREIEAGTAELQDAEGQSMSAIDAKAYVATLP